MSICQECNQEMIDPAVTTCTLQNIVFPNGTSMPRVPHEATVLSADEWMEEWRIKHHVSDTEEQARLRYKAYRDLDGRCHDCKVARGGYHHPGCGLEWCPRCGLQHIMCYCHKVSGTAVEMRQGAGDFYTFHEVPAQPIEASEAVLGQSGFTIPSDATIDGSEVDAGTMSLPPEWLTPRSDGPPVEHYEIRPQPEKELVSIGPADVGTMPNELVNTDDGEKVGFDAPALTSEQQDKLNQFYRENYPEHAEPHAEPQGEPSPNVDPPRSQDE